jgi:dihydropteroate synthase
MHRVGCGDQGVRIMAPKAILRLVRLEQVPAKAANILKQEMLARGGDAAVHWKTVACEVVHTDVILLGTERQLTHVCEKLHGQPFGLAATGAAVLQALRQYAHPSGELRCGPYRLPWGAKTYVMGIINMAPDSFSGGGLAGDVDGAVRQAARMIEDGADLLDIGGESTRPGAEAVPLAEELRRVIPAVRALASQFQVPISVDTYKSAVAREALAAGARPIGGRR